MVVRDCQGDLCPTRRGGNRAIDYHLVNRDVFMEAISDHRVICCNFFLPEECRAEVTRWFKTDNMDCLYIYIYTICARIEIVV